MPEVVFHALAEREFFDIVSYYQAQDRPGLCEAFMTEVERVIELVASAPSAGTLVREDGSREFRLRKFPYSVIYRHRDREDHLRILAIAAHKRRPTYWHGRR